MKYLLPIVAPILMLSPSCANEMDSDEDYSAEFQSEALAEEKAEAAVEPLDKDDSLKVCRAGHGFSVGREPEDMDASVKGEFVRLSYTRDDGKFFRYDCKITGNVISTRMIDEAGPGSGPGIWSGRGSTSTFKLGEDFIQIREVYFDGSSSERTYDF